MGRHINAIRDTDIMKRLKARETLESIATLYNIRKQRVAQIGRKHGHKYTKISDVAICKECGKTFTRDSTQINANKEYCDRKCGHARLRKPEGKYSQYGFIKLICAGCGKEFE